MFAQCGYAQTNLSNLSYAFDIGGKVAVVSNGKSILIDDASLVAVDKGYVYYRSGTQLRRMNYSNSADIALVDKNYGYNTGSTTKIEGTPYYYSYVYESFVQFGKTVTSVLQDFPVKMQYDMPSNLYYCGDKYAYFDPSYDFSSPGGTLYYLTIADFSIIQSTEYKTYVHKGIALSDSAIFLQRPSVYNNQYWFDVYNYKTRQYKEKAYQIPDMLGFAELNDIVSSDIFQDFIIYYLKYRDGSKDVYYALFFNTNNNSFTLSSQPIQFDFIMGESVLDAGDLRFGITNNKLCETNMKAFATNKNYDLTYVNSDFNISRLYVYQDTLLALSIDDKQSSLYYYNEQKGKFERVSTTAFNNPSRATVIYDQVIFFN